MKLIIKEYLASLKERKELDAILPDLLSQMGLHVFSTPGIGTRQYGVDFAAFGSINNTPKTVYLFSVKSGDLGRADWNSGSVQDLLPSLEEILTVYIPTHLPVEYRDKPIEICLCIGGVIKEEVRLNITQYENAKQSADVTFSEWDGDKLASFILKGFLREDLLPIECRYLLRKSLAMLDEPDVTFKCFSSLITLLLNDSIIKSKDKLTALRQLNLCLWILFAWSRDADNLEASYNSSERVLLYAWDIVKDFINKNSKIADSISSTFESILTVHQQISIEYIAKVIPHITSLYALSNAVRSRTAVDANLKLFDILSRMGMVGAWATWSKQIIEKNDPCKEQKLAIYDALIQNSYKYIEALIINNPLLFLPCKDDQVIDISIVLWFMGFDNQNLSFMHYWLSEMVQRIIFSFEANQAYPCTLSAYSDLIRHPAEISDEYKQEATVGSVLYPMLATFSVLFGFDDIYKEIQNFKNKHLKHCNFQLWYPNDISEDLFYKNTEQHGATLSDVCIEKGKEEFLEQIFKECEHSSLKKMSAVKKGFWPIIFLGCRHYRLPIPVEFLESLPENNK